MSTTTRRTFARALILLSAMFTFATLVAIPVSSAHAATFGERVIYTASTRKGMPYQYGADGPTRFDCSGLTRWTFAKLGRSLPHSAARQYNDSDVHHIISRWRHSGDLVFFHNSRGIYHVGIYAGNGYIWHSPYSGAHVRKERIWTSSVYYGRVK